MKTIPEQAEGLRRELVAHRRELHRHPELGAETPRTSAYIQEKLEELGIPAQALAGHGLTAVIGGVRPGRCILLRADMDALPLVERSGEEFASLEPGRMHACGHDLHTAMLLGAARLLKEREGDIPGRVKLMFQPAEENLLGARAMVEAGALEDPHVDAAAMFHVLVGSHAPAGTILVPEGGVFASASDWFEVHIRGKGGHGAMPEQSVDPLNAMSHIHLALQAILSREVAPGDPAVLTVGAMGGGETSNVIPETAWMKGTIRAWSDETREFVIRRAGEIARSTAEAFRATAEFTVTVGCPPVRVDGEVSDIIRDKLSAALGDCVLSAERMRGGKMTGSEDFAYVAERVPSTLMQISAGSAEEGFVHAIHHPEVRFSEDILPRGAAAYALAALGWLEAQR